MTRSRGEQPQAPQAEVARLTAGTSSPASVPSICTGGWPRADGISMREAGLPRRSLSCLSESSSAYP